MRNLFMLVLLVLSAQNVEAVSFPDGSFVSFRLSDIQSAGASSFLGAQTVQSDKVDFLRIGAKNSGGRTIQNPAYIAISLAPLTTEQKDVVEKCMDLIKIMMQNSNPKANYWIDIDGRGTAFHNGTGQPSGTNITELYGCKMGKHVAP